ncbi:MAG: AAA family ATPase [Thermodesulfobacterium sp.]|nr:AAA family ATPase [Thermodesulfobacterium sp.]
MENYDSSFLYLSFFNLRKLPFNLVPDPRLFFPSRRHLQILDILKFSILQGSLISVIVGEPGVGKTQALLTLLERLPQDSYHKVEILNPALSPEEFLKSIFWGMETSHYGLGNNQHPIIPRPVRVEESQETSHIGVMERKNLGDISKEETSRANNVTFKDLGLTKDLVLKFLKEKLMELKTKQAKLLLIIDEAQLLPDETLEELRLITNLNEGTDPVIQILLIGQPNLRERLASPKFLPLRQRISVFEELKPLDKDEILPYLWFRINQVSDRPEINFHKNILRTLYKSSKGIPRLINKLMDRALFLAYTKGERVITKKHLKEAKTTFENLII